MCIIVDANVVHEFILPTADSQVILSWLTKQGGVMASGGRLKEELLAVVKFRSLYQALLLAGRLYQYADQDVNAAERHARQDTSLVSDDPHVIGLARVSNSRVLFTRDRELQRDFCNPSVLAPRGHVYQRPRHRHLLRNAVKCRTP